MKLLLFFPLFVVLVTSQAQSDKDASIQQTASCGVNSTKSVTNVTIVCGGITRDDANNITKFLNKLLRQHLRISDQLAVLNDYIQSQIPKLHGRLIPADDPTTLGACSKYPQTLRPGDVIIHIGDSTFIENEFPVTPIIFADEPIITIDKNSDGISVSTKVFSEDRRIIAEVADNHFDVNPNNYFRVGDPSDPHTFKVIDQYDREVLNVHFDNDHQITIRGIFGYTPEKSLRVTNMETFLPNGNGISAICERGYDLFVTENGGFYSKKPNARHLR